MDKKRTRSCGGGGGSGYSNPPVVLFLPHELVVAEMLTRLPAKSLMRFKCVSKLWCSTIGDPSFCEAHRARSHSRPALLMMLEDNNDLGFFSATLSRPCSGEEVEEKESLSTLQHQLTLNFRRQYSGNKEVMERGRCDGVTQVINGLFCSYTLNRASLYNISTYEIMELPPSSLVQNPATMYNYYFGYDYTCEQYKLLKICVLRTITIIEDGRLEITKAPDCEILTLGKDPSWRDLKAPIIDVWKDQCVHINNVDGVGVLYWWHPTKRYFVSFDLKNETFQWILPPPNLHYGGGGGGSLHQFRGQLALVRGIIDRKLQLSALLGGQWYEVVFEIPFAFADRGCSFIDNLPTGEMLFTGVEAIKSPLSVYLYDHNKERFVEFVVTGNFPSSQALIRKDSGKFRVYYYEENITPLKYLISNK